MNRSKPPLSDEERRTLYNEHMAIIPFSARTGMAVTAVGKDRTSLALPPRPTWCGDTRHNRIHTGCLCALADTACGFAVATAVSEAGAFATLDLRMDYLRSADAGTELYCHAHCHRVSRNVAFVTGELRQPGCEDTIALVNATFMRTASGGPRRAKPGEHTSSHPCPPGSAQAGSADTETPAVLPEGRSPYVDYLGVALHAENKGGPVFRLPYREDLIGNPNVPALHGGVLGGFGETVMILHLIHGSGPLSSIPKAVDFSIDYLRPARPVDTFAQGLTVRQGNRVSLVQANLWQEDPRRPVAAVRGHWLMPQ